MNPREPTPPWAIVLVAVGALVAAWIIGREPIPERFDTDVMERIRRFRFVAHTARQDPGA